MMMTEEAIKDILKGIEGLPAPVHDWIVETGEDWTGDPAVWVWAILAEKDLNRETRTAISEKARDKILSKAYSGERKDAPLVYTRFRSAEEMAELHKKAAK